MWHQADDATGPAGWKDTGLADDFGTCYIAPDDRLLILLDQLIRAPALVGIDLDGGDDDTFSAAKPST